MSENSATPIAEMGHTSPFLYVDVRLPTDQNTCTLPNSSSMSNSKPAPFLNSPIAGSVKARRPSGPATCKVSPTSPGVCKQPSIGTPLRFSNPNKSQNVANHIPSDPHQVCRVCEGRASGLHFGEYTCESCKLFFLRQTKHEKPNQKVVCPLSWNCDINTKVKSKCRACRFKKCCEVGMSKDRVVYGRNARAKPAGISLTSPLRSSQPDSLTPESHRAKKPAHSDDTMSSNQRVDCSFSFDESKSMNSEIEPMPMEMSQSYSQHHQYLGNYNPKIAQDDSVQHSLFANLSSIEDQYAPQNSLHTVPIAASNTSPIHAGLLTPVAEFCQLASSSESTPHSVHNSPSYVYGKSSPSSLSCLSYSNSSCCISPSGSLSPSGSVGSSSYPEHSANMTFNSNDSQQNPTLSEHLEQLECWSILKSPNANSVRTLQAPDNFQTGPDMSQPHITNDSSLPDSHIFLQRAVFNSFGEQHHQQLPFTQNDHFPRRTVPKSLSIVSDAFFFDGKQMSSKPDTGTSQSGNSSGSESSDDKSIEFTGPDGLRGRRGISEMRRTDSNVSELWLELPNLDYVCKYCFKSPCYCFGVCKM